MSQEAIFKEWEEKWPSPVVARQSVHQFSGGILSPKFLANQDSMGTGPEGRFKIGRSVCYPVRSLIDWMRRRSS